MFRLFSQARKKWVSRPTPLLSQFTLHTRSTFHPAHLLYNQEVERDGSGRSAGRKELEHLAFCHSQAGGKDKMFADFSSSITSTA